MKKHLHTLSISSILLFLILFTGQLRSHTYIPFAKDSSLWAIEVFKAAGTPPNPYYLYNYESKGDTSWGSKTYVKAEGNMLTRYMREDSGKVYVRYQYATYQDSSEFILYNFNLAVNDTFTLRYYSSISSSIDTTKMLVTYIDSVNLNTGWRKRITLKWLGNSGGPGYETHQWIEGVGDNFGPFYNEGTDWLGFEWTSRILCYTEKNVSVIGGVCILGMKETFDKNDFYLSPNPTNGKMKIEVNSPLSSCCNINVINIAGQKVYSERINKNISNSYYLNLENYPKGLYILQLETEKSVINKKFIIE